MSEDFPALAGFRAGTLVAGYRLEAQVGAGGMAVVFRARDERLGRLVALKILAPSLALDSAFRRRFIAESRAAAVVDDPYIIPVYEAGEADGVLFIAMRFVRGGDLRGVLEREGALAPFRAAEFISPVASALDAAHRAGLVHRDVKPANILVDARDDRPDHVYLSDFGVSKGAMSSVSLTGTGQFLGTPDYSAPEQIQGLAVDGRTDQYALACVAYQLLTGAAPFERDQGLAVLLAHLSAPPPSLASRRPDLSAAADQVLSRGLAKEPEKRFASCRDFAEALREALGLARYHSRSPAPGHPQTQVVAAPQPELPGPATAGSGKAARPADPVAAATIDSVPGDRPADAADLGDPGGLTTQARRRLQEREVGLPQAEPMPTVIPTPGAGPTQQDPALATAASAPADAVPPVRETAPAPAGLAAGQAVAGPDVGPAPPLDAGGYRATLPPGDDYPTVTVGGPEPGAGETTPRAPRPRRIGRAIRRRSVITATAMGIALIGLVTAITIISGAHGTSGAHGAPGTSVRWSYTSGNSVESSPAVAGGTVYIGSDDDSLYALDAATGHLRWSYSTGGPVESSPAVAGGIVYIGSDDDSLYALDAATGHLRWSYSTGGPVESSPAVAGGIVYIGSDDNMVYALDAATGQLRWSYTIGVFGTGPGVESGPAVAAGIVFIGSWDDKVYAVDAATGHLIGSYSTGGSVESSPAVADGIVYIGSDDDKVYALSAGS